MATISFTVPNADVAKVVLGLRRTVEQNAGETDADFVKRATTLHWRQEYRLMRQAQERVAADATAAGEPDIPVT